MEILIVLIVLAVIAAAAFLWMRSRNGAPGRSGRGPALHGRRGDSAAERQAMATDPHEPASERRLRAQANRVAAVVHSRQAAKLDSQAGRGGRFGGRGVAPADPYGQPAADPYGQPAADPYGQPAADPYGQPAADAYDQPAYDDAGQPMYVDGQPVDQDGQPLPEQPGGPVPQDEQGRPIHPEDRPRP